MAQECSRGDTPTSDYICLLLLHSYLSEDFLFSDAHLSALDTDLARPAICSFIAATGLVCHSRTLTVM